MFPRHEGDMHGTFVLDYLKAVEPFCNVTVLDVSISGVCKGVKIEKLGDTTVYRYTISAGKPGKLLKPLLYMMWFYCGYKAALTLAPDIIHAHGATLTGTMALSAAKKIRAPVVITEHTGPFAKLLAGFLSAHLTKRALERADAVLVVSDDLKNQILAAGITPKKVLVTYNPVNTDLFVPAKRRDMLASRNIVFVGRLENYKGALRTVKAFRALRVRHYDWTLTIVGDGPEYESIKRLVEADDLLRGRVTLKGRLHKEQIAREIQSASFFVMPSEHETFGISIAEAMACGLPVIVGDETAPREFVDAESGLLVPATDVGAIAMAMEHLIGHRAEYDVDRIRGKIVTRFGLMEFGKRLQSVYTGLM